MCVVTVRVLNTSASEMAALDMPAATRVTTSSSRLLIPNGSSAHFHARTRADDMRRNTPLVMMTDQNTFDSSPVKMNSTWVSSSCRSPRARSVSVSGSDTPPPSPLGAVEPSSNTCTSMSGSPRVRFTMSSPSSGKLQQWLRLWSLRPTTMVWHAHRPHRFAGPPYEYLGCSRVTTLVPRPLIESATVAANPVRARDDVASRLSAYR